MPSTLVLIPTSFERQFLSSDFDRTLARVASVIQECGFGIAVSGARTCQLIAEYAPRRVLLIGIAGALNSRHAAGDVLEFHEVMCYGIGAGTGSDFVTAQEMGWGQSGFESEDKLTHSIRWGVEGVDCRRLLTGCSASANPEDVRLRLEKFPHADAEDMEGFAVAVACTLMKTPFQILRGISNRAGDRNKLNWRVKEAMAAVEARAIQVLNA